MSTSIKYAYKKHNTWVYRRTYPQHLQVILGSALKQSLKTADASQAKARVAELNQTFTTIIKEAQAHALSTPHTAPVLPAQAARLGMGRPRYQRVRLVGDGLVAELAQAYLAEVSQRLRPGSYKSVRFALELLTSHLGKHAVGDLTLTQGKEVLGYITQLSPNVRKYRAGKDAGLADLARLAQEHEGITLAPQTQARILKQISQFLDWCVGEGELQANPWAALKVKDRPEVHPHGFLADDQLRLLLSAQDRVLHKVLLFALLTGLRSGEVCGLLASDITAKGNLGRFVRVQPNSVRQLKSKAAEREVPLHSILEGLLDTGLPTTGRLFPGLSVDLVVKRYASLRRLHPGLRGTVFHSTRKWFITQCERTGVPEHFTASLVGHVSARSANRLTYGLYSSGISDTQKRDIVDQIRLPDLEPSWE